MKQRYKVYCKDCIYYKKIELESGKNKYICHINSTIKSTPEFKNRHNNCDDYIPYKQYYIIIALLIITLGSIIFHILF